MNIKLLNRICERITEEPGTFSMEDWFISADAIDCYYRPPCGTAACIAGHAILLSRFRKTLLLGIKYWSDEAEAATYLLHLSEPEADRLFFAGGWPSQFRTDAEPLTASYAANAVARIQHFIATNGAE